MTKRVKKFCLWSLAAALLTAFHVISVASLTMMWPSFAPYGGTILKSYFNVFHYAIDHALFMAAIVMWALLMIICVVLLARRAFKPCVLLPVLIALTAAFGPLGYGALMGGFMYYHLLLRTLGL